MSCYDCEQCNAGDINKCTNKESLGAPSEITFVPQLDTNDTNFNIGVETEDNYTFSKLISKNSVLALVTEDGESAEYYLFKATTKATILKHDETDKWGASYKSGAEIFRGYYFNQSKDDSFKFNLLSKKSAILPVQSILYIYSLNEL